MAQSGFSGKIPGQAAAAYSKLRIIHDRSIGVEELMRREGFSIFGCALILFIAASCRIVSSTAFPEDLGKGDGTDVIAIGDSWVSYDTATGIQQSLRQVSGQPYRAYGVGGTQLLNGQIPSQYAQAKRDNPNIKTVIMTGGGNDLLRSNARADLSTAGPFTRMRVDEISERLVALWTEMGKDGVRDIVYIFYSRGGGIAASVDYGTKKIQPLCQTLKPARCHWVDSDITLHMTLRDGTHPTDEGFNALAKTIYDLMGKEGMRR
jgi:lysophospholipase L1-like esterase